jgi:hypothetical protein
MDLEEICVVSSVLGLKLIYPLQLTGPNFGISLGLFQ